MNTPYRTELRPSVSTWALHPLLGTVAPGRPGDPDARLMAPHAGSLDVIDVPAQLAARGIRTMELCHFHVPDRRPETIARLRGAREAAGVELWSLLIDDGDLVHPEVGDRDREWIRGWVDTAADLGARCVRVIAGKQAPTPPTLERAVGQLRLLTMEAYVRGVRVLTENWFQLLPEPAAVHALLEPLQGAVGLNLDFGNWSGDQKYEWLAAIAPYAEGSHAKCGFEDGAPDTDDFTRCLTLARAAGFSGPFTLVHGEPGDVWGSLDRQRALLEPFLAA
jgi:sugar phosphate isomerase/epimerase